jgi:hypothetical protein
MRYLTVAVGTKKTTAIERVNIFDGSKQIYILNKLFSEISFSKGKFICSDKTNINEYSENELIVGSTLVEKLNKKDYIESTFSGFIQKDSIDGYTAILSNYITNKKRHGLNESFGSCIKLIQNTTTSSIVYSTLVFPDLNIRDFNFIPPHNGSGALFTIVGTTKIDGKYKVRMGSVDIPNICDEKYIINSFTTEIKMSDDLYSEITRLELYGIAVNYLFISGRKASINKKDELIIYDVVTKTVDLTDKFTNRIENIKISKSEKMVCVSSKNSSIVYNSFGIIVNEFFGEGCFI